jgi:hypothetical protein
MARITECRRSDSRCQMSNKRAPSLQTRQSNSWSGSECGQYMMRSHLLLSNGLPLVRHRYERRRDRTMNPRNPTLRAGSVLIAESGLWSGSRQSPPQPARRPNLRKWGHEPISNRDQAPGEKPAGPRWEGPCLAPEANRRRNQNSPSFHERLADKPGLWSPGALPAAWSGRGGVLFVCFAGHSRR